jgi:hypothetical protein
MQRREFIAGLAGAPAWPPTGEIKDSQFGRRRHQLTKRSPVGFAQSTEATDYWRPHASVAKSERSCSEATQSTHPLFDP